jgi:hypothetical protein
MARRIFEKEDAWTEEASHAANDISVALADILALLEVDGPVDIRDFHYLASSTLGNFVAKLAISRRLGDPASPPDPSVRAYPRLSTKIREATPWLEEGWEDWIHEIVDK